MVQSRLCEELSTLLHPILAVTAPHVNTIDTSIFAFLPPTGIMVGNSSPD
jgi:hypothetical protein